MATESGPNGQRNGKGQYVKGHVGEGGRPPGIPDLVVRLKKMLSEDAEEFERVAKAKMRQGDPLFWRMLLERVWPAKLALVDERDAAQPRSAHFIHDPESEQHKDLMKHLQEGGEVH